MEVEIYISPGKNRILKKKTPSKRNQNPSGYYYNSDKIISSLNTSQNISYFKNHHIKNK